MNGSTTGIIPTMEIGGNNGNNGWGGSMGEWIIGLVALGMLGNGGLFGGFGGGNGMYEFPWLLSGQNGINNNTNDGFQNLHLSNQIEGVRDGVNNLTTQICGSTADVIQAVNSGFAGAEISSNARQIANMQQAFNTQTAITGAISGLSSDLASCCCENRLGLANLTSTVISENCADREALSNGIRDIISNQTASTQRILDQLCNDKIDAKNEKIADLQREILMKDLQASQVAQTADLRANNAVVANQLVSELRSCPIPAQPVYGNQPIFTCPANYNGCGCGYNTTSQFI